jgi:HptB-dependent secretion and biofilm anti anti-sigma factor
MTITSSVLGKRVVIHVNERFDRWSSKAFQKSYQGQEAKKEFVVDLKRASSIDSSAIGQLLILREYAGGEDACVSLINCSDAVRKMFRIANLQTLFEIS